MHIAFVGSRAGVVYPVLDRIFSAVAQKYPGFVLVSGGANGIDKQSEELAYAYGHEALIYPADWKGHSSPAAAARAERNPRKIDPIAGFLRNSCILGLHQEGGADPCPEAHFKNPKTDAVVAFMEADSKGTRNTVHKALKAQIPIGIYSLRGVLWPTCPCLKPEKLHSVPTVPSTTLPLI